MRMEGVGLQPEHEVISRTFSDAVADLANRFGFSENEVDDTLLSFEVKDCEDDLMTARRYFDAIDALKIIANDLRHTSPYSLSPPVDRNTALQELAAQFLYQPDTSMEDLIETLGGLLDRLVAIDN